MTSCRHRPVRCCSWYVAWLFLLVALPYRTSVKGKNRGHRKNMDDLDAPSGGRVTPPSTGGGARSQFQAAAKGNFEAAKQRAAERAEREREEALRMKEQGLQLAEENKNLAQQNMAMAKDAKAGLQEMRELPPSALAGVAQQNKARMEQQYAANKAMLARNRDAMYEVSGEAQRRMEEVQGVGRQALETAASATIDIARGEFEARCARVAEQEGKLQSLAIEIERREKQLSLLRNRNEPNWPCNCCCFSPVVHHDIVGDIPRLRQSFMHKAYYNWFYTVFLLIANFGVALTMMFLEEKADSGMSDEEKSKSRTGQIQHVVVSGVILSGIIFSFVIWYWPTYKALGTGSSGQFIMAKCGVWIGFFFNVFVCLGPLGYGGCGLFYALHIQKARGGNAMIAAIVLMVLFGIQAVIFIWMFFRIRKFGKEDRASLLKAKSEMMVNEVRSTVGL